MSTLAYMRLYRKRNSRKLRAQYHAWYLLNRVTILKNAIKYYKQHSKSIRKYHKNYYKKNYMLIHKKKQEYNLRTFKQRQEYRHKWYMANKGKALVYNKTYSRLHPEYRIRHNLSIRLNVLLKGKSRTYSTIKLIGCSINKLKQYLEKQFRPGMSWSNYGKWHVDHIKPCASFNLSSPEEQKLCFHYTNLQPLWAKDNIAKGCKY